jgi:transposase
MEMARYGRIVIRLRGRVRGQLRKLMQTTHDARLRTRLNAVLLYADGRRTEEIASVLGCSTSTAIRAANGFLADGVAGLVDRRCENGETKADDDMKAALVVLVRTSPQDYGWERSTWTTELFGRQLEEMTGTRVSDTTVGRMLHGLKVRWGKPRPIVLCPWPKRKKTKRIREIEALVENLAPDEAAFYQDEVDIHLNPRIGWDWMFSGEQKKVVTPGNNVKRCVAGGLNAKTGRLLWVVGERRNSALFLEFLRRVRKAHPTARKIHLIVDNCKAHTSQKVRKALKEEFKGAIELHFLPSYSPEHNPIERLWGELHANVTRNHRCKSIEELLARVKRFLKRASPFPGSRPSLAKSPPAAA